MISLICKKYGIENYTINPDGSIDVNGSVDLSFNDLTELPLRFNKVTGSFDCGMNKLTSLKGSPRWIGDWFSCEFNYLTDNYCDSEIGGYFYTTLGQDGLTENNYNEWRKLYKRKQILNQIFDI
jgi:hypothetical protein